MYEEVTRYIYQALGEKAGVQIDCYGSACKSKGKSGVEHQIDVLTNHTDGIHIYKTAIECKYWSENVNKDIVMKVAEIVDDCHFSKGVIVSKKGFTEDAISYAKHRNIGLVELRELNEDELRQKPRIKMLSSKILRSEITNIVIVPSLFNRSQVDREEVPTYGMLVKKRDGEIIQFIDLLKEFEKELQSQPIGKMTQKRIMMPMSELINKKSGNALFIDGVEFTGFLKEIDFDLKFHVVDEVWMIMKSLFEEKTYTISKRGIITEKFTN